MAERRPTLRHEWTRADVEARLERTVAENRFTIAVVFPVVGAALLLASAEGLLPPLLAFNPLLVLVGVLVMRLPLVAGLAPLVDRRAAGVLAALTGYVYVIEYVGVRTGWPYGDFHYAVELGPMVAGVPLALPVFFVPLALNAYLLSVLLVPAAERRRVAVVGLAVATLLAVDLVLDPAAVAIGFWSYAAGGPYYGVPLSNYAGWLLSGAVAVLAVDVAFDRAAVRERLRKCRFLLDDLVSFTLLWGAINLAYGNAVPVLLTALLVAGLVHVGRFDFVAPAGWARLRPGAREE